MWAFAIALVVNGIECFSIAMLGICRYSALFEKNIEFHAFAKAMTNANGKSPQFPLKPRWMSYRLVKSEDTIE